MEISRHYIRILEGTKWDGVDSMTAWRDSLWSGYSSGTIKQRDAHGHCVNTLKAHNNVVTALLVWRDFLYSGSYDKTIRVWNSNGECVRVLEAYRIVRQLEVWKEHLVSLLDDRI